MIPAATTLYSTALARQQLPGHSGRTCRAVHRWFAGIHSNRSLCAALPPGSDAPRPRSGPPLPRAPGLQAQVQVPPPAPSQLLHHAPKAQPPPRGLRRRPLRPQTMASQQWMNERVASESPGHSDPRRFRREVMQTRLWLVMSRVCWPAARWLGAPTQLAASQQEARHDTTPCPCFSHSAPCPVPNTPEWWSGS